MIDALTLTQLKVLVAVVETGSFSGAARRLGRVQSAISQTVQTLEETLSLVLFDRSGKTPVVTEAGLAMVEEARQVLRRAAALRHRAEAIADGVEPELTLAVDAVFPSEVLTASLKALQQTFPGLPVALFTEGLGAPEQRLRDGMVRLAIYTILATGAEDLEADLLTHIAMVPVVAAGHPLAQEPGPVGRAALERHTQLILTDRSSLTPNLRGHIYSPRVWRFADLTTRLDFLLAGFGWCHMPIHLVEEHIDAGRLRPLVIPESEGFVLALHAVRRGDDRLGRAGRWLIADLRARLAVWRPCKRAAPGASLAGLLRPSEPARPIAALTSAQP
ncbi:LysR family transcriptional regulator [Labrys wisconsinensis]|uniref:DNA-binding transcriptional LysR family regulator n=1 Tax=Labrys wisconsinensis TaxID=425677 RepID=A0ABU0JJQ2_9HYPH|nr:LysR family transcriptional regulator [Labrys wisconsinensis]MDQ0473716.1 DNA-binding transcriptional LysR family regulator [Labrys wisconsinensis]